jgi:hypothetical protein
MVEGVPNRDVRHVFLIPPKGSVTRLVKLALVTVFGRLMALGERIFQVLNELVFGFDAVRSVFGRPYVDGHLLARIPLAISRFAFAKAPDLHSERAHPFLRREPSLKSMVRVLDALPYNFSLTKVQARFKLDNPLDEQLLERIRDAQAIYGIERIKVEDPAATLMVEYDATRLRPAEVESALRQSGIAVTRI